MNGPIMCAVALLALKSGGGYFGANINVVGKGSSRDACKEQFYCS